jgi:hypothetical protein
MATADPLPDNADEGREVLQKYFAATQAQAERMRGVQMDVDIEATLPKLQKEGQMHALRMVTKLGKIAYHGVQFVGDNTIKKEVIARYLTAEVQPQTQNMGINDVNYKFKFKGLKRQDYRTVYIFSLTPRRKSVGLFKGELWVDPESFLPIMEAGQFVKTPSVFLKKVSFVRLYEIKDGLAIPRHIESTIDARVVGKAVLAIDYSNFGKAIAEEDEPAGGDLASTAQPVGNNR